MGRKRSSDTTVDGLMEEIRRSLGIEGFRLEESTGGEIDEKKTLSELKLFPKGVLLLIESK